jgi:AcrR family transcriptional regulator
MSDNGDGQSSRGAVAAPVRRKVGRPPKLDRQMIARAAHEIGLTGLTMKAVADRLGVSVPGLYHHVDGKEDLLRLAAEYSAARMQLPADRGQHWAVWLFEWAEYNRDAFVDQPELLRQYMEGAISAERTATTFELVLTRLVREGFTVPEAARAYVTVTEYAVGAAVNAIRERRTTADGHPPLAELHRVLAQGRTDEYPNLRTMVADLTAHPGDGFRDGLRAVLRGLAAERGARWSAIETELRRAHLDA